MINTSFRDTLRKREIDNISFTEKKREFEFDVKKWFADNYNIPVRVLFFVDSFGVETHYVSFNPKNTHHFSIDLLYAFCKEFGCEFQSTRCADFRYIFYFDGVQNIS